MESILLYAIALNLVVALVILIRRGRGRHPHTLAMAGLLALTGYILHWGPQTGWVANLPIWIFCYLLLAPGLLHWLLKWSARNRHYKMGAFFAQLMGLAMLDFSSSAAETMIGIKKAREGQGDQLIAKLQAEISNTRDFRTRYDLLRRLLMLLAAAQRYQEVVDLFTLPDPAGPTTQEPFAVHLVWAQAELGLYEEMAATLAQLEMGELGENLQARAWMDGPRLVFLSIMGQAEELANLLVATSSFAEEIPRDRIEKCLAQGNKFQAGPPLSPDQLPPGLTDLVIRRARESAAVPRSLGWGPRMVPVTSILVTLNVLVYILSMSIGNSEDPETMTRMGASYSLEVLRQEPWRIFASIFLHCGPIHMLGNMLALVLFGRLAEQVFGPLKYFLVYLAGGLAGVFLSVGFGEDCLRVGASGAILGVIGGAVIVFSGRHLNDPWPQGFRRQVFNGLSITLIFAFAFGIFFPMIDNLAHLGGAIGGIVMALIFRQGLRQATPGKRKSSLVGGLIVGAISLILAGWTIFSAGKYDPLTGEWQRLEMAGYTFRAPLWWGPREEGEEEWIVWPGKMTFQLLRHPQNGKPDWDLPKGEYVVGPRLWRGVLRQEESPEGNTYHRLIFLSKFPTGQMVAQFAIGDGKPKEKMPLVTRILDSLEKKTE